MGKRLERTSPLIFRFYAKNTIHNMKIATNIQNWCDRVYYDNITENGMAGKVKALGASLLSGAIDGCILGYPIAIIRKLKNK